MDKKGLADILHGILKPMGFKKKGSRWAKEGGEITKMVFLDRSYYSARYYIRYGFILNLPALDCVSRTHIESELGSFDHAENERLKELLDLENTVSEADRTRELTQHITNMAVTDLQEINTEDEMLAYLKRQPDLNDVPLVVKRHFGLPLD